MTGTNGNAKFMSNQTVITLMVAVISMLLMFSGMNSFIGSDLAAHETEAAKAFTKMDRNEKDVEQIQKSLNRIEDKIDALPRK